jgi:hypothetical protein
MRLSFQQCIPYCWDRFDPTVPTLVMIGEKDDRTPAAVGYKGYRRFLATPGDDRFAVDRARAEEDARLAPTRPCAKSTNSSAFMECLVSKTVGGRVDPRQTRQVRREHLAPSAASSYSAAIAPSTETLLNELRNSGCSYPIWNNTPSLFYEY